jgi:hypothetical protein
MNAVDHTHQLWYAAALYIGTTAVLVIPNVVVQVTNTTDDRLLAMPRWANASFL